MLLKIRVNYMYMFSEECCFALWQCMRVQSSGTVHGLAQSLKMANVKQRKSIDVRQFNAHSSKELDTPLPGHWQKRPFVCRINKSSVYFQETIAHWGCNVLCVTSVEQNHCHQCGCDSLLGKNKKYKLTEPQRECYCVIWRCLDIFEHCLIEIEKLPKQTWPKWAQVNDCILKCFVVWILVPVVW